MTYQFGVSGGWLRPKREIRRLERKYGVDYREIQEGNCRWHWWESSNSYRQDVRVRGLLAELQELKRANKIRVLPAYY